MRRCKIFVAQISATSKSPAYASGSVLVSMGQTRVICGVAIEEAVPRWVKEQRVTGGWLTAEYSMLPYSTQTRKPRDVAKGRLDGRSVEIQRVIGRSLRAVMDLEKLGSRTIWVDCDVLQADGGTRTTAITGAKPGVGHRLPETSKKTRRRSDAKIGRRSERRILHGQAIVDLNYEEDKLAAVDWKEFVKHDPRYERPAEVDLLIGDPSKAKKRFSAGNQTSRKHLGQMP